MVEAVNDPAERRVRGIRAREEVTERYAWAGIGAELAAELRAGLGADLALPGRGESAGDDLVRDAESLGLL